MKKVFSLILLCVLSLSLTSCGGKEITLDLSFGSRTGTYSGEMKDGVPDGEGTFKTTNKDGETWTYKGEFKNGHFEGEGETIWESGQKEIGTYKNDEILPMPAEEIKSLYTDSTPFKNHCAELIGSVFRVEKTEDGVAVQMWTDIENSNQNTVVYIYDTEFEVHEGEYLKVLGIIGDDFEGENAFGGEISAVTIDAKKAEIVSYSDALSPTLHTKTIHQTQTQYGYSITLEKLEFAENETRAYLKMENNGSDAFSLFTFDSKLSQNGKQYAEESNWDADYPELETDLLPGNHTEGVIVFPKLEDAPFTLRLEGCSDNFDETVAPFIFEVN